MRDRAAARITRQRWWVPHPKLVPPRLPETFVHRAALRDRLAGAAACSDVTLVCAPAGYGKTLLLAEWAAIRPDVVWVSLDQDDGSAERFLAAVLSAIAEYAAVRVIPAQTTSGAPPTDVPTAIAEFVDAIEALPEPVVMVLDNLQAVRGRGAMHVLMRMIRHQPRDLRLVLATRSDPPLPLARLRLQGRLTELRADALRFGHAEAGELLERSDVTLTDDQLRRLMIQTDGWPAALRLAARSLRLTRDPERLLVRYASHDHAMADFLAGEVLVHLTAGDRDLLAMLSVCERVTPRLATSLTGREDLGEVLAGLERDGVLVSIPDGEQLWYQLRPVLRAYLRADLARHQPELVGTLHRRAAAWFADQDSPREAFRHAEQSGDERASANLLHDKAPELLLAGRPELVLGALRAARTAVARDPWLLLLSALAHLELGDLGTAETDIARGTQVLPAEGDSRLSGFRRLVLSAHAVASGHSAVPGDSGPCCSAAIEAWERLDHGLALLAEGDDARACRELDAAGRLADEQGLSYLVVHTEAARAVLAVVTADLAGTVEHCERALALAGRGPWERSPWLAVCHAIQGFVRLLQSDPRGARRCAQKVAAANSPALRFAASVIEGVARFDTGERLAGLQLLHDNRAGLADAIVPRQLAAIAMVLEHECALSVAQFRLAREVTEWGTRRLGPAAEVHLTVARTLYARGDLDGTEQALDAAQEPGVPRLVAGTDIELDLLAAATALRFQCRTKARGALDRALALAASVRAVRPFAHVAPDVRRLLLDQMGGFGAAEAFAAQVRHTLAAGGEDATPGLTSSEHAVLERLTSSHPLDEVALELRVSVNTVKTHVRAIYAKLGVNNRRAAVMAARELGLD